MLIYTVILTLVSIAVAAIYPAAYHTSISNIIEYLYISQLIIVPIVIWSIYILNKKNKLISNTNASIINTLLLIVIPLVSGAIGRLIIDDKRASFEKLKREISIDNIEDRLFYSEDGMPIGITIVIEVVSPKDIRLYPYITLESASQPKDILKSGYPDFRYHKCELKDRNGKIIFTSSCKDLSPSVYSKISWSKHTLKSGESYFFSISMVPDNCVSSKYSIADIGRPFKSSDYGPNVPVNYQAEIVLFQYDGVYLTTTKHITNSKYLPKSIYKNLSKDKNIICG